jgi:hypothetical protein
VDFALAFIRNIRSGGLQPLDQRGVGLCQRLKLVEHRIEDVWRDEHDTHQNEHRWNPEPEPPARRPLANHQEDQHRRKAAEEPFQREHLGFVAQPTAPTLHRQAVSQCDPMPMDAKWKIEHMDDKQQQKHEAEALHPAVLR